MMRQPGMVQGQTNRPTEQKREFRNGSMNIGVVV